MTASTTIAPPVPLADLLARLPALAEGVAAGASEREAKRELPFESFALFRQSGLGAIRIPTSAGGPGGSLSDLFDVIVTLAKADSNVAHALRLHFDITESLLLAPSPTPLVQRQIDHALSGAIFGGASTELGTARPGDILTVLKKHGDHFRLSGKKYYATGTAFSDYARINVVDEAGAPTIVVIPVKRAGVHVLDDWDGMGQRLTASGSLEFHDVEVFADEVAPRESESLQGRHGGALRQLHLVAVAAGIVRNIVDDARGYVTRNGRPVAHSPAASAREDHFIQQVVGELAAHSRAIDTLVRDNARILDRSAEAIRRRDADADARVIEGAVATAETQIVVARLALQAGERIFDAGGASATSRAHNFDRHWRNLRTIFSHNPLSHKARVIGDYHLNGTVTHLKEGRVF